MKKIILILMIIVFLSGCELKTEINFKNDSVSTVINGEFNLDEYTGYYSKSETITKESAKEQINELLESGSIMATSLSEFNKDVTINSETYLIELDYDYDYDEFNNDNNLLNTCFDYYSVIEKDDFYLYTISGNYKCNYSTSLILTSENGVGLNNADNIKNNKYTWNIKEENNDISFAIYKTKHETQKQIISTFRIIFIIILSIVSIIMINMINKRKQNFGG